jgi:hypothetical protein
VYLVAGWADADGETHCIHENTPAECAREMKYVGRCVKPCCCR